MPHAKFHAHLGIADSNLGPFTPVSPSNLEQLTIRSQQVRVEDTDYFQEAFHHHPVHPDANGYDTPGTLDTTVVTAKATIPLEFRPFSLQDVLQGPEAYSPPVNFDEAEDRRAEVRADAERPFPVDRSALKDVVENVLGAKVAYLQFLSSGTFHKAFLVHLIDRREIVARLARRFMPRLKVESEVATINYLRDHTNVPVPTIFHYDSNPYNKLGYEYILMSKAPGVPLSYVYHHFTEEQMTEFMHNLASIVIPILGHRFPRIGSLYQKTSTTTAAVPDSPELTSFPTPSTSSHAFSSPELQDCFSPYTLPLALAAVPVLPSMPSPTKFPPTPPHSDSDLCSTASSPSPSTFFLPAPPIWPSPLIEHKKLAMPSSSFYVGPIISWPFFGEGRGELESPSELDRGPWRSESEYISACARREIEAVRREAQGTMKGHKPHLMPVSRKRPWSKAVKDAEKGKWTGRGKGTVVLSLRSAKWNQPGGGIGSGRSSVSVTPRAITTPVSPISPWRTSILNSSSTERDREKGRKKELKDDRDDGDSGGGDSGEGYSSSDNTSIVTSSSSDDESSSENEDTLYRDYRASIRSSLLVAQHSSRMQSVINDMERFRRHMEELGADDKDNEFAQFAMNVHDLSLHNIFVDPDVPSRITCIIDWESTTVRPLWHCAHLPAFITRPTHHSHHHHRSSPPPSHAAALFRNAVRSLGPLGELWLRAESECEEWREAHKFLEWDGWEEGLLDSVIGERLSSSLSSLSTEGKDEEGAGLFRGVGGNSEFGNPDVGLALVGVEHGYAARGGVKKQKQGVGGTVRLKNGFVGLLLA